MRPCRGFTLVELMVTIAIAAIFLTIAIPSFVQFTQNARRDSQLLDIVNYLNSARSEAVRRGQKVTVCPSTTGSSCTGANNWDSGWIVFADADGDGTVDGGETIMGVHQPLPANDTLRSTNVRITFQNTGYSTGADTLRLCDARGTASARNVQVSAQGMITTGTGAASCP